MSRTVRLSDVAAASGVSVSTASRVLNGGGRVSEATRQRILDTAARLSFRPNSLARSFALGRSYAIGVIAENALEVFTLPVILGASSTLGRHDMATLLLDAGGDRGRFQEHLDTLVARRVDGLIVIGNGPDIPPFFTPNTFPVPVVYAFAEAGDPTVPSFIPDSAMAGRLAAEYLTSKGRTRLVHVSGDVALRAVRERATAFHDTLTARGAQLVAEPRLGSWQRAWGHDATAGLLAEGVSFDGMFAGNDEIATGALWALREAGLRVPEDVELIGYDNITRLITLDEHEVTTIDPNLTEIGSQAALELLEIIKGRPTPGVHRVSCSLVDANTPRRG